MTSAGCRGYMRLLLPMARGSVNQERIGKVLKKQAGGWMTSWMTTSVGGGGLGGVVIVARCYNGEGFCCKIVQWRALTSNGCACAAESAEDVGASTGASGSMS